MKKFLLTFIGFFFLSYFSQALSFSDIPKEHYCYEAVKELSDEGIISGYEDNTFKPSKVINRAEFLKITIGVLDLNSKDFDPSQGKLKNEYQNCFKDVGNEWFAPYICYAKEQDWVGGYPDKTFRPGNNINFGEAFAILGRIFELNVEGFDKKEWYYPYQRYLDIFNLVGDIEQSISFQVNRGEMVNLVYQIREHLDCTEDQEIEKEIAKQKRLEEFKVEVFHLVNTARIKNGLNPLVYNIQLEKTAQMHAEDMVKRDFFAHVNPDGIDVMTRVKTYKYDQRDVGENIALGQINPDEVMENWLNSPPHRKNLLKSNFTEMGVGVTEAEPGEDVEVYGYSWVQVFGKPCEERDNMIGCTTRSDYQERNADDEIESNRWESPYKWY